MKYKVIVSDFDWTLGETPNYISERNLKAIEKFQKAGGKFVVCTGRFLLSIRQVLNLYNFKGDVIASQGSVIGDVETGEVKFEAGIDSDFAGEVVKVMQDKGFNVMCDYHDNLFYLKVNEGSILYENTTGLKGVVKKDLANFLKEKKNDTVRKLLVYAPDRADELTEITDFINTEYKDFLIANSGAKGIVEIIDKRYTKGVIAKKLIESYGYKPEEVMTMGDSTNDKDLMGYGFHGVATGDGAEDLRKLASEIAPPFPQDPVAQMIEKYLQE